MPLPGEDRRGQIAKLMSIHVRGPEADDRKLPGHWEGELMKGAGNASAVGTLVERATRLLILVKLPHILIPPQQRMCCRPLQTSSMALPSLRGAR